MNPLDLIGNLFKTGYNIYQDQRDYNYQKNLQKELFERDDNAIQRRMLDAQKAGINPLFAIGSGVGGVTSAGTISSKPLSLDSNFFANQQLKSQEKQAMEQEKKKREIEMKQMEINLRAGKIANWQAMQDLNTKRLEQDILKKQIEQMETSGLYPLSGLGKTWSDVAGLFIPALNAQFERWAKNPTIQKLVDSPLVQGGTPDQIEPIKEKLISIGQKAADYLGQKLPVVQRKVPVRFISEYEARVLRGSSDKKRSDSKQYGFSHKSNTLQKYSMKKNKF